MTTWQSCKPENPPWLFISTTLDTMINQHYSSTFYLIKIHPSQNILLTIKYIDHRPIYKRMNNHYWELIPTNINHICHTINYPCLPLIINWLVAITTWSLKPIPIILVTQIVIRVCMVENGWNKQNHQSYHPSNSKLNGWWLVNDFNMVG